MQFIKRHSTSTPLAALQRCWREWTAVVDLFALGRPSRRRLEPQAYVALHQELLEACRAEAKAVDEGERAFYEGLEELARPWLSLRVLQQADQDILLSLLDRCQKAEWEMMGRAWTYRARRWARPALTGLAALAMVLVGCLAWQRFGAALREQLHELWIVLWLEARGYSNTQWWLVAGLVLAAVFAYVVSRAARG